MKLPISDVLRDEYVDSRTACEILGIAIQTLHNKTSTGDIPCSPVGYLATGGRRTIWRRADIEAWAESRMESVQ
jgi:predicted DNA-binding transcriptional regulator AlpA